MKLTIDFDALNDSGQPIEIDNDLEIILPVKDAENKKYTATFTFAEIGKRQ